MSAHGELNQSQRITFVTNIPTLATVGEKAKLPKEQLAILVKDGSQLCSEFKITATPDYDKSAVFKIAQGSNKKFNEALIRAQIPTVQQETIEFKPADIIGWRGVKAKHSTKEDKIALGYDGVDLNKTLKATLGQTIVFYLRLQGTPIDRLVGHTKGLNREYIIDPRCLNECVCLDPCSPESCRYIQAELVRLIKEDKFNNIPITTFIKVSTITSCDPALPALSGLVGYTDYCVSQCDNGDATALGLVQAQYPTLEISVKERVGAITTYRFRQLTASAAPAALSNAGLTAIPNCATCPAGYTYVANTNAYEVTVPAGAALPTITGIVSSLKVDSNVLGDTYIVYTSGVTAQATTLAQVNTATITGAFVSITRDLCTLTTPSTTAWAACGTCNKAPKSYDITLGDTICGTSRLAALQAAYPDLVISIKTVGTCAHTYTTSVLSNCFVDGCTKADITWTAPSTFENNPWVEVPAAVEDPVPACSCGVVIEGARFVQDVDDCDLDYFDYDARLNGTVHIDVTSHNHDYTNSICKDTETPVTYLQVADLDLNDGRSVQWAESESMSYFFKMRDINPVIRKVFGYNYNAKANVFYDEYQLTVAPSVKQGWYYSSEPYIITYRFFFPEGKGKQFENAINGLVTSAGLDKLSAVVL